MVRCPLPAVLLLLAAGSLTAAEPPARVPLPGESAGTGRRLDAADRLAADKQYSDAAAEYARIIDEAGDDLVAVDANLAVPARRLCQLRLAALPPEALKPYRTRVDAQAKKLLEQGAADHDMRPLLRVVDEAFCSRPTETALDLLGDLAFERGRLPEAARWWRMLALPASEAAARAKQLPPWEKDKGQRTKDENVPTSFDLLYPDPQSDVARARAKQILALLFQGETEAAKAELDAFRALHPKAEGHLAGRRGNYADTLQALIARPVPPEPAEDAWPTFGGAPSRGGVLPAERSDPNRLNALVKGGPAWEFRLGERRDAADERPSARQARHLAFHPVIVGRHVIIADAQSVTAYDTAAGDKVTWDLGRDGGKRLNAANALTLDPSLPAAADLRYTLSAADGRIYARLGVQGLAPTKTGAEADSFLVCLKLTDGGRKLTAAWVREAEPRGQGARAAFEGAPVVADGLLHVAATRFEGGTQMVTEVRCYSADSDAGARWRQDVVATRDVPTAPRYRHQLLTRAGRYVVYASHAGAVIALDAATGRRAWAYRYPSAPVLTPGGNPVPRDLAPALYAGGRLYVAPADYDRLLCLDPETGRLLWERERIDVVHLLGVGSGRLIFTTPKGIRAVRAADGDDAGGWLMPEPVGSEGLPSYGRGFLAGRYVFWPTTSGVKVLSQEDGQVPIDLIPGPLEVRGRLAPGNLAYAGGILAVGDQSTLRVYLAPSRTQRAATDPPALDVLARRATELTKAGKPAEAVAAWQRVLDDDALRRGTLHDAAGLPQIAAVAAAERIDELLRANGRGVYAPLEEKAGALLASAKDDPAVLVRLVRGYPNAEAADQARRRLLKQEKPRVVPPAAPSDHPIPLARAWEKDERLLPLAEPSPGADVFLVRDTALVCRDAATGAERWSRPLAGSPSWAGCDGQILLAAGPHGAQGVALVDGAPLWEMLAPDAPAFADPRLSAFQLTCGRFFCLQGECRLLGLDARSGKVLSQNRAPAARLGADVPGARLSPHYLATAQNVLLQTAGRGWVLDATGGRVERLFPTEPILWPQAPLPLDKERFVVVNGRATVVALDVSSGKGAWTYVLPGNSTLSGEPPLVFGDADGLFVVVPRNAGYTLQRLDPTTGQALWSDEVTMALDRLDPWCFAFDGAGVYYTSRNVVTALDRDGKPLWEQPLPSPHGPWRLRRTAEVLLVWPAESPRTKFHSRWLSAALEYQATFPPQDRPGGAIPVLLLAPAAAGEKSQGDRVMQRLNFAPPVPRAQGRLAAGEELTAVPRALAERAAADGPVVVETASGLVVGWEGRTWALRRDK